MARWRLLLTALVAITLALASAAPAAVDDSAIDRAVAALSDPDASARERATMTLWQAGRDAEPALRKAAASDDPEVAGRAAGILFRVQSGLLPDTPQQVLDLIHQYNAGGADARRDAIAALANQGNRGLRVLICLRRANPDAATEQLIRTALCVRPHEREGAALLLAEGEAALAMDCLKNAADDSNSATRDWAALMMLRGGLDVQIAAAEAAAKTSPDGGPATRVAWLARAAGNLKRAAQAADEADDPQLLDSLLIEAGDWQRLSLRYRQRIGSASATLGFAAAFSRLAGDQKEFERAAGLLRAFADHHQDEYQSCANCLMLNDQVDEGLAVLASHKNYVRMMEFLLPRLRIKEALALPETARADGCWPGDQLQLRAGTIAAYRFIGDRNAAERTLAEVSNANRMEKNFAAWLALADGARQLDKPEEADHCLAEAMSLLGEGEKEGIFRKLALPSDFPAAFWWEFLRSQSMTDPYEKTFAKLRQFGSGALPADEVDALAAAAEKVTTALAALQQESFLQSIGQTLALLGRKEHAERVFRELADKNPTYDSLERVGDCEADRGDYIAAATTWQRAWDMDRTRAVPLALRGWALLKAGDAKQGRECIELAHALPLGDEGQRTLLDEIFRRHDLPDDARRERDIVLKTGTFLSWNVCIANRVAGDEQNKSGHFLAAADCWDRAFLGNIPARTSFVNAWANVMIPAMIHRTRAMGLITQDADAALREATIAMSDSPGDTTNLIDLVNAFDEAGHKPQADALFAPSATLFAQLCDDFPDSGQANNLLAWVQACCHRNLDDALKHALRAVELEPKSTANIDTLAEVYFQQGRIDQAIAEMNKCVALEPTVARHRQQILRFESARGGKDDKVKG